MDELNKEEVRLDERQTISQQTNHYNTHTPTHTHTLTRNALPRRSTTLPETRAATGSPSTGLGWSKLPPPGPTPATPTTFSELSAT
jgi:hypothetical protein